VQQIRTPTNGAVAGCAHAAGLAADAMGHIASAVLVVLTVSIMLGIALRWVGIDNSWTYDLDTFALVWSAFAGAAYTSLRGRHVTAGIALENMIGRATVLSVLRFAIVGGFLALFFVSAYWDTSGSYQTAETTIDVDQWPVWIAKAALPAGLAFWFLAELAKFLRAMLGEDMPGEHEIPLDE
jgi:TRAP-type C4-dicarboxylate transport system permease small subunit